MEAFETLCRKIRVLTETMRDLEDEAGALLSGGNDEHFDDAMSWIIEVEDGRQTPRTVLEKLGISYPVVCP